MSSLSSPEAGAQRARKGEENVRSSRFTLGICVSDSAPTLTPLLEHLKNEVFSPGLVLDKIVVVASGCSEGVLSRARGLAREDERILLIEESERHGKAEALNKIIERFNEDYLVFVNGDALPSPGSVDRLLRTISSDRNVGAVSGAPTFETNDDGITSDVLRLMWMVHNDCSWSLNHKGTSNHGSDELLALRADAVAPLPSGLVNDGGYLTGLASSRGFKIRFCQDAPVRISVPARFADVIGQRRRIIFGHIQVWKMIGRSPLTVESMLFTSPLAGLAILVRNLARNPKLIRSLPVLALGEVMAAFGAILDTMRSTRRHVVWKRYGD
jgi:cellulose synthase/poly-beta-1,6-N-acetylglucosamine synthase-like glycosyltransferase